MDCAGTPKRGARMMLDDVFMAAHSEEIHVVDVRLAVCVYRTMKVNETPAFAQVSKGNSEEETGGGGFFVTQADTE